MRNGWLWAVLLLGAAADAAELRVAVLPFSGENARVPRRQIVRAVCLDGDLTCVPSRLVMPEGERANWAEIRRRDVSLVVAGRLRGPAAARVLEVEAYRADKSRVMQETLPLEADGSLAPEAVRELDARLLELAGEASPEKVVQRPQRIEPRPPPEVARPRPPVREPAPLVRPAPRPQLPLVALEGGIDLVYRSFQYDRLTIPNLRTYRTDPIIPAPRIRLEMHPLVTWRSDALASLGLEVDFLSAIGLKTVDQSNRAYPTTFQRLDIGMRWSTRVGSSGELLVTPTAGFRYAAFDVGRSTDGQALIGFPDVRYEALRAGIGAEYPLGGPVNLLGRVEYAHPLGFGGIRTYFPHTSGASFDLEAGAGYQITSGFELRARAHYSRYLLYFRTTATDDYQAAGASDDYLGLGLLARYAFSG
jgi:hypothetical protein